MLRAHVVKIATPLLETVLKVSSCMVYFDTHKCHGPDIPSELLKPLKLVD